MGYRILTMDELRNAYQHYHYFGSLKRTAIMFETVTWYLEMAFAFNFREEQV